MREREKSRLIPKFWPEYLKVWCCHHLRCGWSRFIGKIRILVKGIETLPFLIDVQVAKGSRELYIYLPHSRYLVSVC